MTEILVPVLPATGHDLAELDCGKPPLNDFRFKCALQNQASGGARMHVIAGGGRVIGFYSLASASVIPEDTLTRVLKGRGCYAVPVVFMALFAIDKAEKGKGFGNAFCGTAFAAPCKEPQRSAAAPSLSKQLMSKPERPTRNMAWSNSSQIRFTCFLFSKISACR